MKDAEAVTFGALGEVLDRAAHLRPRAGELAEDPRARVLVHWRSKVLIGVDDALAWNKRGAPILPSTEAPIFLGLDDSGAPLFAADLSDWAGPVAGEAATGGLFDATRQTHPDAPGAAFAELRSVMALLSPADAALAASAVGLFQWHRTHPRCARCGEPSTIVDAGWSRHCTPCGARHFPRTDPVVIVLVTKDDRVLVGRSPAWPEGMYSLLAGFMEPGETIEAAARREVFEESGVRLGQVDYLASQPWPFPASLMIGCHAEALSEDITLDPVELEDAIWVPRAEMAQVQAGSHPALRAARPGAIARFLIERWLSGSLK